MSTVEFWASERRKSYLSLAIFDISDWDKNEDSVGNNDRPTNTSERFPKIFRWQLDERTIKRLLIRSLLDHAVFKLPTDKHFRTLSDHFHGHWQTSTSERFTIITRSLSWLWVAEQTLPKFPDLFLIMKEQSNSRVFRRLPDHFSFRNRTHPNGSWSLPVTKSAFKS